MTKILTRIDLQSTESLYLSEYVTDSPWCAIVLYTDETQEYNLTLTLLIYIAH